MNIFIYSDESGVFDFVHNEYFVFGGIVCFGKKEKETLSRKYSRAESIIKNKGNYPKDFELKASNITNSEKGKLFRSLNNVYKFCAIIDQNKILKNIFENKRHKQRYLDYVYKIVLKKLFNNLINKNIINSDDIENIYVFSDEHNTATDGRYELRENLLNEFKIGTFNSNYKSFFPPIFPNLKDLELKLCNSKNYYLIRAADIISNHFYHKVIVNKGNILNIKNTFIYGFPDNSILSEGIEYFEKELQLVK